MPNYEHRGKSVRVKVMRKGVRHSATFRTLAAARLWAARFKATSRAENTLADALRAYSAKVSVLKRGRRWEQIRIERFLRTLPFASRSIESLQPADIADWRDARLKEVSRASVQREMALLSGVFQWATLERRWIPSNPCHSVSWPAPTPPRKRRVSPSDIAAILSALNWKPRKVASMQDQVAVAFLLAIETAMRAGELLSLSPDQVFLKHRYVHLDLTKNGDSRDVPLSKAAVKLFGYLIPHDGRMFQISSGSLDTLFRKARDKAGLVDLHFHDTRREATTRLSKKLEVMELAAMTGHRDLKVLLKTYYSPEPMEAAKKLG